MRFNLLTSFIRALIGFLAMFRHMRRVNRLSEIARGNPTDEAGFLRQQEAIKELNHIQRDENN